MPTTSDYLTQLEQDREDLVDNLETKGITGLSGDETFTELVPEVLNIPSGGGADLSEYFLTEIDTNTTLPITQPILKKMADVVVDNNVTSLAWAFRQVDFHNYPAPKVVCNNNVTDIQGLFYGTTNVTSIDFSGIDSSNCTSLYSLFYATSLESKLTNITFGNNFDTRKVTIMRSMFYSRSGLTSLDLSMFETPVLTNTRQMFQRCTNLAHIDIRKMTLTGITDYTNMFSNIPLDCEIIVKDDTQKAWITSKFTSLTNVKTVAEYEAE